MIPLIPISHHKEKSEEITFIILVVYIEEQEKYCVVYDE
jgi:hypothetical protein